MTNTISLTKHLKHPPHTSTHSVTPSQTHNTACHWTLTAGRLLLLATHTHTHTLSLQLMYLVVFRQGDREKRKIRKNQINLIRIT